MVSQNILSLLPITNGYQLYAWRSKINNARSSSEREQEMSVEIARLKRQLAEQAEELAILQKAATYFAKRLK